MDRETDSERLLAGLGLSPAAVSDEAAEALMELAADNARLRGQLSALEAQLVKVESLADSDPLCPLFNRRAFMRELEREITLASRHNTDLSVLYIDLDEFKRVNDVHGHEVGDTVLIAIAKILKRGVRRSDIVARIGGDEFGIILVRCNAQQSHERIETLTEALNQGANELHGVHASIGAVTWQRDATASTTLNAADRAMFAKKPGIRGR